MNPNHDPKTGEFSSGGGGKASAMKRDSSYFTHQGLPNGRRRDQTESQNKDRAFFNAKFGLKDAHATLDQTTAKAHEHLDIKARHPELDQKLFDKVERFRKIAKSGLEGNPAYYPPPRSRR